MLVTGSRLPISAPCTHLRNKPCTGDNTSDNTGWVTGISISSATAFWPNLYRIETRRPPLGEGSTTVADTLSPLERWVVHRQSGDKPGQLRFRHCGSGGHRIRKRTHGARTVRARCAHGSGNTPIQCHKSSITGGFMMVAGNSRSFLGSSCDFLDGSQSSATGCDGLWTYAEFAPC